MSSRSARKHGLATTSRFRPAFAPGIEAIANPICPGTRDPLLLEQAQIIGATTCVLGMRVERMARMERLHNCMLRHTEHAPDFQLFGRTNPKSSRQGSCRDHRTGPVGTLHQFSRRGGRRGGNVGARLLAVGVGSRLGRSTQAMVTRYMGLIVGSMGMQFVLTGLKAFLHT
jgi:hypothetical protein